MSYKGKESSYTSEDITHYKTTDTPKASHSNKINEAYDEVDELVILEQY